MGVKNINLPLSWYLIKPGQSRFVHEIKIANSVWISIKSYLPSENFLQDLEQSARTEKIILDCTSSS